MAEMPNSSPVTKAMTTFSGVSKDLGAKPDVTTICAKRIRSSSEVSCSPRAFEGASDKVEGA
jgi:hypothetical protein